MNTLNIIGRITKDLELKKTNTGLSILKFSIAYNEKIKNNDMTYFFNVTSLGKSAETISNYFKKGNRIGIVGKLTQSRYQDKNGNNKSNIEIFLEKFFFIENKNDNQSSNNSYTNNNYSSNQSSEYPNAWGKNNVNDTPDNFDDGVPF